MYLFFYIFYFSDVVVQIVDARNPLLFRCEDLEAYVKEVNPNKDNLLLINKSDFLTETQRETWAEHFRQNNVKAVFFSALSGQELDEINEEEEPESEKEEEYESDEEEDEDELSDEKDTDPTDVEQCRQDLENLSARLSVDHSCPADASPEGAHTTVEQSTSSADSPPVTSSSFVTSSQLLSRKELIEVFRTIHTKTHQLEKTVTIGLVGYPNVGKSSTINCLMQEKKVSVSATPGKTKHFQVLYYYYGWMGWMRL